MSEMVERLAETLYYKLELEGKALASGDHWAGLQESSKRKWRDAARAAIEAMRDPGEDFAGYLHLTHDLRPQDWQELIDAALE